MSLPSSLSLFLVYPLLLCFHYTLALLLLHGSKGNLVSTPLTQLRPLALVLSLFCSLFYFYFFVALFSMAALQALLDGIEPERKDAILQLFNAIPISAPTPAMAEPSERELEADRRDLARTLAQVLKPQRPSPYSGAIDADACINFIDNQKEYFTVVKLGSAEWVQYTALNLIDDAKSWWRSSGLTIHTPWDTFEIDFLNFHTPPNAVAAARAALETLKQGKRSVALYTHEFRRLLRRVPTLDKGTALHWFEKGLETDTSKEVKLRQPPTLEIAITQATLIHSILYPNGPTGFQAQPQQSSDMEVDNLHVAVNNLTTQVNYLARQSGYNNNQNRTSYNHYQNNTKPFVYNPNTNYKPGGPLPPKLSDPEKTYLYNNGGCYRCRKLGHLGPDCKVFPSTPRPARQFNNIEASAPQQAPSQTQSGKAISN